MRNSTPLLSQLGLGAERPLGRWSKATAVGLLLGAGQLHTASYAQAATPSQSITLVERNVPLSQALKKIEQLSGYTFLYNTQMVQAARPVTLNLQHATLAEALNQVFAGQALTYTIEDKSIIVKAKPVSRASVAAPVQVTGIVRDENGVPIPGVTVRVKSADARTTPSTATDANGHYNLMVASPDAVLIFSYVGYEPQEIALNGQTSIEVQLRRGVSKLDDVVVVAYGTTTQRENTGSVATLDAKTIAQQPVSNPIEALQGRLAGVLVTPTTGFGGSTVNVQIRGQNSLLGGNQPLYVVDGVPYAANGLNSFAAFGAFAPQGSYDSPLNSINPADIASIDVLKDADATAIYGSRGANGVVLITTKKAKTGQGKLDVNVYTGAGRATRFINQLNTEQYLALRREAFANDGITPTASNAPDLVSFDQTRYTDWQKTLIGNTASVTDAQASYTAGTALTRIALTGGFRRQGSIYLGDYFSNRYNGRLAINQASANGRLHLDASMGYVHTDNKQAAQDYTTLITLPPNYNPYNADGTFNFSTSLTNPYALALRGITNTSRNLLGDVALSYTILPGLAAKVSAGLNRLTMEQFSPTPAAAVSTLFGPAKASAEFANAATTTYLAEPQLTYNHRVGPGELQALAGGTFQQTATDQLYVAATDYISDAVLENLTAASTKTYYTDNAFTYRYQSVFGRLNYNIKGKYIVNGTFRRDGSSKFGPNNRWGNFGAGGVAWLFSEEGFIKNTLPALSYGKLRASYGITGNDLGTSGYYDYLATFQSTGRSAYGSLLGLTPTRLGNTNFRWENVKKLDLAIELGFLKDRILFTADYYRSISDNQLVGFAIPSQTGFSSITANFPAVVLNRGFEFSLNTTNVQTGKFTWTSAATLTVPRNELLEFPGLAASFYNNQFLLGEPTTITRAYAYTGINPATGQAAGAYVSPTGLYTSNPALNNQVRANGYPKYFGGLQNSLSYKGFSLDFFLQFTKQTARSYVPQGPPGQGLSNWTTDALRRWQKPGDVTDIPKATSSFGTAYSTYFNYTNSPTVFSDASFLRLKTLSLSYSLPSAIVQGWHLQGLRFYVQGQNLFTITGYNGFDPEVPLFALPPQRVLTGGVQVSI
ncbi:TonB-dependent receptor [Hymenobacter sp. BT559]|uniref:TonB-dependent receptor n=1 Tax=Hymenobacter sp. BT559 TaxID=2795729 RepID=UPI0018EB6F46|nr:TonB-dependent receptor [Hymenobacter sp. BT559]MBJ6144861.1 TonB-dependent receptor [Hymenobacter sp. BT559]